MMKKSRKIFASLLVSLIAVAIVTPVYAQINGNRPIQGLSIAPFILERQMDKGQTLNESIEVTNTTNKALPVDISIKDFAPQGDNGQQTFYNPGEGDPTYSLSKWITINNSPKLVLRAGEKTQVNFTLTAPQDADNGGHYGAVIFSFSGAPSSGSAVEVSQQIGAIILVKLGKSTEDGTINKFSTSHFLYQYPPVTFLTRFRDNGNVHVKPRGSITITNMFGKKIGTTLVNQNGGNVLPNSERVFESLWDERFAFGHYTAKVELVYGDSGSVVTAQTSFWVIPWKIVLGIAIALFILIFGATYGVRKYNQWFMRKVLDTHGSSKNRKK